MRWDRIEIIINRFISINNNATLGVLVSNVATFMTHKVRGLIIIMMFINTSI